MSTGDDVSRVELVWEGQLQTGSLRLGVSCFDDSDLDAICAIERRAHAFPWKRQHFLDSLAASHQHCVGIESEGHWIGYAVVSCVAGEAELLLLVVESSWQGRGVAKALLNHVCTCLAKAADTLFLEVSAENERAIGLYELLDFNQVGVRPNYYHRGGRAEDALIYARTLES